MPTDNSNTLRVVSSTLATLFQTVVIATGQYQPQVVRMPPAKEGVESGCNNIIHECCIVVAKEKTVQR